MQRIHPNGMSTVWLSRWQDVLDHGVDTVLDTLTSRSEEAIELRQNSPFAGVLSEHERAAVQTAFRAHWRSAHHAA
jgi:hypothetical protein